MTTEGPAPKEQQNYVCSWPLDVRFVVEEVVFRQITRQEIRPQFLRLRNIGARIAPARHSPGICEFVNSRY
jgi:hypothetical protein